MGEKKFIQPLKIIYFQPKGEKSEVGVSLYQQIADETQSC